MRRGVEVVRTTRVRVYMQHAMIHTETSGRFHSFGPCKRYEIFIEGMTFNECLDKLSLMKFPCSVPFLVCLVFAFILLTAFILFSIVLLAMRRSDACPR